MGKRSKQRKRALGRAKLALKKVIALTETYYNNTRLTDVCNAARSGLRSTR